MYSKNSKVFTVTLSILLSTSCISITSCNISNKVTTEEQKNVSNNNKVSTKVKTPVKFDLSISMFNEIAERKSFDLKTIKKLNLEVKGIDISETLNVTKKWSLEDKISFSLDIPEGSNRIIILSAIDEKGIVVSNYMGVLNVIAGKDNITSFSDFDTAIAQTVLSIFNSDKKQILNTLKLEELKEYFYKISGYNKDNKTFDKIVPQKINTAFIADNIIKNNGSFPTEDSPNLQKTGNIKVNLNQTGAKLILSDINSGIIASNTSNQVTINDVSFGEWNLNITKEGFLNTYIKVNVKDSDNSVDLSLPADKRIEPSILVEPYEAKVLYTITDQEFGISVSEQTYTIGIDEKKDGSKVSYINGALQIPELGKSKINIVSVNYPVMSNSLDTINITSENISGNFNTKNLNNNSQLIIKTDQELQYIHASFGNFSAELEFNLDSSWTVTIKGEETVIRTVDDIKNLILKHSMEMKNISLHSLFWLYLAATKTEILPAEFKKLTLASPPSINGPGKPPAPPGIQSLRIQNDSSSNYNDGRANVGELLRKIILAIKELSVMFQPITNNQNVNN